MTTALARTVGTPAPATSRTPSLVRLTGVELRKLVDTRAGRWLLIAIGLVAAVIITLQLAYAPDDQQTFASFFGTSLFPVGVLLPVLGILSITTEWSQRTALTTFALVPRRERVIIAKLVAVLLAALASVLVCLAVAAVATLVAEATGGAGIWRLDGMLLVHALVLQVSTALIGVAFGLLLLHTPLAIVAYLVLPIAWSILGALVQPLYRAGEWLDTNRTMEPLFTPEMTGGQWQRLVVSLLLWLVVPLVAGLVRTMRQEVT
ncbi:ABC transporter permease [Micromonospora sp. NPDC048871]|uniref:ABC transporter permease n=1 Tax=Micromonospora sp. NPDC048871 TaxID=3364259 RepID=UPI00371646A0